MVIGSLFSGIGGLELGLEWAGLGPVAWQVESDPFRRRVLRRHWPDARRYNDIRRFDGSTAARVSIICGGFPCQDVSLAGRGDGIHGSRTGLWWEMHRVIGEHRPLAVIIENVPGLALRGLDAVVDGLIDLGYMVEASRIRAADAGAPHLRGRLFILGYALRGRCEGRDEAATAERSDDRGRGDGSNQSGLGGTPDGVPPVLDRAVWPAPRGAEQLPWEPMKTCDPHSVPFRYDRVASLGDAVVPHCAFIAGMRVRQRLNATPRTVFRTP